MRLAWRCIDVRSREFTRRVHFHLPWTVANFCDGKNFIFVGGPDKNIPKVFGARRDDPSLGVARHRGERARSAPAVFANNDREVQTAEKE